MLRVEDLRFKVEVLGLRVYGCGFGILNQEVWSRDPD